MTLVVERFVWAVTRFLHQLLASSDIVFQLEVGLAEPLVAGRHIALGWHGEAAEQLVQAVAIDGEICAPCGRGYRSTVSLRRVKGARSSYADRNW